MTEHPFYENLDTTFVDFDALVRYLRRRKFVGRVRLDFTGYTAEIAFTANGKLRVREDDKIAGCKADGETAFTQILLRAKETGGLINVMQAESEPAEPAKPVIVEPAKVRAPLPFEPVTNGNGALHTGNGQAKHVGSNGAGFHTSGPIGNGRLESFEQFAPPVSGFQMPNGTAENARAHNNRGNFKLLIEATALLLNTIDRSLGKAGLDFPAAFEKACSDVSPEYPFLDPQQRMFKYSVGDVYLNEKTDLDLFAQSLGSVLVRIFGRLNAAPQLGKVYRNTAQRVRTLVAEQRDMFDRLSLTHEIERAITL